MQMALQTVNTLTRLEEQSWSTEKKCGLHTLIEPRCEKTGFLHMRKQRRRSASHREADQRLCFRYTDSTIPLLLTSEISSL